MRLILSILMSLQSSIKCDALSSPIQTTLSIQSTTITAKM